MRRGALLGLALLAGCGAPDRAPAPQASEAAAPAASAPTAMASSSSPSSSSAPALAPSPTVTPPAPPAATSPKADLSALDSRDCRTVAQAYFDALARGDYGLAARVWSDPAIDQARLKAAFAGYKQPRVAIAAMEQEGAAGSSYCTVSGTLSDGGDAGKPARKGQVVLKRVNDVPGATPQQLRWTIRSSTFVEKLGHAG
jgi:hypothetical protein